MPHGHLDELCTYNGVSNNAQKTNNVGSACQVLKDLDFTSNLLLLDWLQSLDDALFIVDNVDTLKDLRVFATAYFANDFIVFLVSILVKEKKKKDVGLIADSLHLFIYSYPHSTWRLS